MNLKYNWQYLTPDPETFANAANPAKILTTTHISLSLSILTAIFPGGSA